jgi:hypothetical protein
MTRFQHLTLQTVLLVAQVGKHYVLPPELAGIQPYLTVAFAYAQAHLAIYNHPKGT